ncbi:MAG: LptF/LptG family permease [Mariprofundales bacterium]|nr:LptF/LptG family permease [Mariprofundales bacterium]
MMVLERYLLRLWWQPFIGSLLLVTAVLLLGRTLKLLALFANKSVEWSLMGTMLLAVTPYFIVLTLPIAFMFAMQHMLLRLQQDNELDAMQAAGISYLRLLRPLFVIALLLWILLSWTALQWMPQGQKMFQVLMVAITKLKSAPEFQPQRIDQSLDGITIYIKGKDRNGTMHGLLLEDHRYRVPVIYMAQSAELIRSGSNLIFTLHNGTRLEGSGANLRTISFARYQITESAEAMGLLKLPKWRNRSFEMDAYELWQSIADNPNRPDLIAELHRRLILPTTTILLAIFALPLSIQPKRSGRAAAYLLGIGLVLALYNTQIILHQQVLNGTVGPWIMWLGQGLFLTLACWLFHRVSSGKLPFAIHWIETSIATLQQRVSAPLRRR